MLICIILSTVTIERHFDETQDRIKTPDILRLLIETKSEDYVLLMPTFTSMNLEHILVH